MLRILGTALPMIQKRRVCGYTDMPRDADFFMCRVQGKTSDTERKPCVSALFVHFFALAKAFCRYFISISVLRFGGADGIINWISSERTPGWADFVIPGIRYRTAVIPDCSESGVF